MQLTHTDSANIQDDWSS